MRKFVHPYSAQGDLNIIAVDSLPDGLVEKKAEKDGKHILAHSETGHHHVVDGSTVRVLDQDEFTSYMEVKEETNVVHLRSFDTHETIALPPGNYLLTRQIEDDGLDGWRRAAD